MREGRIGLASCLLCATAVSVGLSPPGRAQQRDTPRAASKAAAGAATLVGAVVSAEGGRPLRGAVVQATGPGSAGLRSTLTDGEGRFTLSGLTPGAWTVHASKAGFVGQQSGQRHPLQPARPFQIDGAAQYSVDFALTRGGAITGHIINLLGEPVSGARIEASRSQMVSGRRQLTSAVASDLTDDTGAFRLHSLPAGDYFVSARLSAAGANELVMADVGLPTYFPGTSNAADATRITLGAGEERSGVSFSVFPARTARVSGSVVSASGTPAEGATVELLSTWDFSVVARPFGNFGLSQDGGRFTMLNVAPGTYTLFASLTSPGGEEAETAFVPVSVVGDDVSGISIATAEGATISGTIAAAPGSVLPSSLNASVTAQSMRRRGTRTASMTRGGTSFTLRGLFGPFAIAVEDLPEGWAVQSVDLNGTDASDGAVEFPASGRVVARIVLTDRLTEVTGVVSAGQAPAAEAVIVIFPGDSSMWTHPSRRVRVVRADRTGRFRVAAIPPGSAYLAIALDYLDADEHQDPEVLERLRSRATSFSLAEGERTVVNLTVVPR